MSISIFTSTPKEMGISVYNDFQKFQDLITITTGSAQSISQEFNQEIRCKSEPANPVGVYVHELEGVCLSATQNLQALASQIEKEGNAIKTLEAAIKNTQAEKIALNREIEEIEEKLAVVKKTLIETNLRTVFSYARKNAHKGLPFADLVQAGKLGLEKAVETFDANQGVDFFAYVIFWIRLSMARAIVANQRR